MSHLPPPPIAQSLPEEQALDWFVRQQRGLSPDEQVQHQLWLHSDPANQRAYASWQTGWDTLDVLPADGLAALNAQLQRDLRMLAEQEKAAVSPVRAAAGTTPQKNLSSGHASQSGWRKWTGWLLGGSTSAQGVASWPTRWAAPALVLLMLAGGGYGSWQVWQNQPIYSAEHATARGQQSQVKLPDGSLMRLDTLTHTDVTLYRQRRQVRLSEGQAMFQVAHDPSRPFEVLAGPLRITVVGTRFSVRYTAGTPGQSDVRVAVEEGRVRVEPIDAHASNGAAAGPRVELTAGEQIASDAQGGLGAISSVPAAGIAPWRNNRVSFDNTPLDQALAEFARYGTTQLRVEDPAVAGLRVTGTFDPLHLGNFVRALPQVLPVRLVADPMAAAETAGQTARSGGGKAAVPSGSTTSGPWLVVGR